MPATPEPAVPSLPPFRGRIGRDPRSGHYAVPRRYRLHLSLSCPHCLGIAVTHSLLGLADVLPVTLLPAVPDRPDGGHTALLPLYEASSHRHPGPAAAPVLSDDWTGRIVSTHTPDILRDLARQFGPYGRGGADLFPPGAEAETDAVRRLCEHGVNEAAQSAGRTGAGREEALAALLRVLGSLEWRLTSAPYLLGDTITVADVELWVTLVRLDTVHRRHLDAAAVEGIAGHPRLWDYARRLAAHPAFGPHLDLDGIARRHDAHCRGPEAAGAALRILDWGVPVVAQTV
ncbi:glutathione S-transferase C-terminal domain-containing protein [Streptomyces griseoviridis]|jgi:putative glutathione S-transferase|uniref:Glutathione S-transferase n=3 Tax=Streptomyces TaxID=1883 RepID=A0ABT9L7I5_STRGD|nr:MULTISPECIES: glutathione S-transferase C-terminal domain-containing protein [Streptomyces]MDP9679609.1 putative glutathione S-transferase [Streptomyces griseoviridis]GGS39967.1 glutathione-dependent reductase [Streptomyces niveoruber]GGS99931.1 glutathione-dependent reductase [Streptomyces griseoviridis]GGU24053.1 glutathione-dependent reductase [Streptomyces daghestanicus]GHI29880.1 glutathione-dependent reductase [Streptomyces daghestanicus]